MCLRKPGAELQGSQVMCEVCGGARLRPTYPLRISSGVRYTGEHSSSRHTLGEHPGFIARARGSGSLGCMRRGGHTSCCSWKERIGGRVGGPDSGVEARASPAAPPPMISVNANQSSRADLKSCPKFGPFLKPKFNSDFDRFWGWTLFLVRHGFKSSVCPRMVCGTGVRSGMRAA